MSEQYQYPHAYPRAYDTRGKRNELFEQATRSVIARKNTTRQSAIEFEYYRQIAAAACAEGIQYPERFLDSEAARRVRMGNRRYDPGVKSQRQPGRVA